MKSRKKESFHITQRNGKDEIEASRKGLANTFAKFYSNLYSEEKHEEDKKDDEEEGLNERDGLVVDKELAEQKSGNPKEIDESENHEDRSEHIPEFTKQELQTGIDCLKRVKTRRHKRNQADDLKQCDDETKEMMREIINEVFKQEMMVPEAWKTSGKKVIFRKGNDERRENYRPICTLSTLMKVFSTLLHNRLYKKPERYQPSDQGAFRRNFQTMDHLSGVSA